MFINDQKSFENYQAPPSSLDDEDLRMNVDARKELVKTLALATSVYEDNLWAEREEVPFVHSQDDIESLNLAEKDL